MHAYKFIIYSRVYQHYFISIQYADSYNSAVDKLYRLFVPTLYYVAYVRIEINPQQFNYN